MPRVLFLLTAACVLLMNTQHGRRIAFGNLAVNLGLADVLLWSALGLFAIWVLWKRPRLKLPPAAMFGLPAVALAATVAVGRSGLPDAAKELFQVVEYFLAGPLLFINLADTREKLRGFLSVFLLAVPLVVLWGMVDYAIRDNAFAAGGAFGNVNVLGTYLALVLPVVFGIALFDDLKPWQRVSMIVPVFVGAAITLSGGALLALLAALLLVLGLRSPRLLPAGLTVLLLAGLVLPSQLRPNHKDILLGSVAVYLDDNHLLGERTMMERARKLGEQERHLDARRLLYQLDEAGALDDAGRKLLDETEQKLAGRRTAGYALAQPVVAARYKGWQAAMRAVVARPWGVGPGKYQKTVSQFYGSIPKLNYNTDEPEAFNIGIDEPDTFNQFLVTAVELGIAGVLALAWFWLWGLSAAARLFAAGGSGLSRGVAAGAAASLAAFPVVAVFSGVLVRGVALPLVFVICCVHILATQERLPR